MESKDIFARLTAVESKTSPAEGDGGDNNGGSADDSFLVVVGQKNSGKTSLVMHYVNPTKAYEPKPTAALDYLYSRRAVPKSSVKAVTHIWELAATKKVLDLLKVPLSPERMFKSTLLLILDLSVPGDVVPSLIYWITLIRKLIADVGGAAAAANEQALAKYGEKHPDRKDVSPIAIPLLIVGAKYETFRDDDSVKRKVLIQATRYIAHTVGATLMFTSVKDKTLATQFRSTLTAALTKADGKGAKELEKRIFIPGGTDTFEEIGLPKGARPTDFEDANFDKRMKMWAKVVADVYPPVSPEVAEQNAEEEKEESEEKFPEPAIDALRKQKREEFLRYKEKKTAEAAKKPASKREAKS